MFTLKGEHFDWYMARYLVNPKMTWDELKEQFILTYTKPNDEARDELLRITQKYNESPHDFLERLRESVKTSTLTDNDVKTQFCNGLVSLKAREYIANMKMYAIFLSNILQLRYTTILRNVQKHTNGILL